MRFFFFFLLDDIFSMEARKETNIKNVKTFSDNLWGTRFLFIHGVVVVVVSELLGFVEMFLNFVYESFFFLTIHLSSFVCRKLQEN